MGKPAARIGDMHVCPMSTGPVPHVGGPVMPPCMPTVLIGGLPAATMGTMCTCIGPPDVIAKGSATVFIGGKPAARMGDTTAHGGSIVVGCFTVLIGDSGAVPMSAVEVVQVIMHKQAADAGHAFMHDDGPCPHCGAIHA